MQQQTHQSNFIHQSQNNYQAQQQNQRNNTQYYPINL